MIRKTSNHFRGLYSTRKRTESVRSGENLSLVGRLLGHQRHGTTAGYANLAAERAGHLITEAMKVAR